MRLQEFFEVCKSVLFNFRQPTGVITYPRKVKPRLKHGRRAVYRGREYFAHREGDEIVLASKKWTDLRLGFKKKRPGVYLKSCSKQELDTAYDISHTAIYGGRSFPANETGDGSILLLHCGLECMEEALALGFKMVEPTVCEKVVRPDELEQLTEKKVTIWGFTTI